MGAPHFGVTLVFIPPPASLNSNFRSSLPRVLAPVAPYLVVEWSEGVRCCRAGASVIISLRILCLRKFPRSRLPESSEATTDLRVGSEPDWWYVR